VAAQSPDVVNKDYRALNVPDDLIGLLQMSGAARTALASLFLWFFEY
jgi:hypothetical protein